MRFVNEVGTSNFITYVERNADGLVTDGSRSQARRLRHLAGDREHSTVDRLQPPHGVGNYLYLDGHVSPLAWTVATADLFPDHVVLTQDSSYPN